MMRTLALVLAATLALPALAADYRVGAGSTLGFLADFQGEKFSGQISAAAKEWKAAAAEAQKAAEALNEAGQRMEWRHYLLAALVGMVTAAAVTASWLWLAPPTIENQITLDAQSVAEQIRGATVPAKPSRSK